jgi:hypothetical protein
MPRPRRCPDNEQRIEPAPPARRADGSSRPRHVKMSSEPNRKAMMPPILSAIKPWRIDIDQQHDHARDDQHQAKPVRRQPEEAKERQCQHDGADTPGTVAPGVVISAISESRPSTSSRYATFGLAMNASTRSMYAMPVGSSSTGALAQSASSIPLDSISSGKTSGGYVSAWEPPFTPTIDSIHRAGRQRLSET